MRSLVWLTTLMLVASATATVALVDYAQRHPETTVGRWLVRLRGTQQPPIAAIPGRTEAPGAAEMLDLGTPADSDEVPPLLQSLQVIGGDVPVAAELAPAARFVAKRECGTCFPFAVARQVVRFTDETMSFWACLCGSLFEVTRTDAKVETNPRRFELSIQLHVDPGLLQALARAPSWRTTRTRRAAPMETCQEDCFDAFDDPHCRAQRLGCSEFQCQSSCPEPCTETQNQKIVIVEVPVPVEFPPPSIFPPPSTQVTRFYAVEDLLTDRHGDIELIETIRRMVAVGQWSSVAAIAQDGPMGEIAYYSQGKMLIVRHTPEVQEQVAGFLRQLRSEIACRRITVPTVATPPPVPLPPPDIELPVIPRFEMAQDDGCRGAAEPVSYELKTCGSCGPCSVPSTQMPAFSWSLLLAPDLAFPDDADTIAVPALGEISPPAPVWLELSSERTTPAQRRAEELRRQRPRDDGMGLNSPSGDRR